MLVELDISLLEPALTKHFEVCVLGLPNVLIVCVEMLRIWVKVRPRIEPRVGISDLVS